jgi:hypothetical protein
MDVLIVDTSGRLSNNDVRIQIGGGRRRKKEEGGGIKT